MAMTESNRAEETFQGFKDSFSYGSRTDLSFKFLKSLTPEEAARFFQQLLRKLGQAMDDGGFDRLVDHAVEWQVRGYAGEPRWTYDDGPFTPLRRPVADARLALVTSSGHFVAGHDPQPLGEGDMSQEEATERILEFIRCEPTLSTIPVDTPLADLRVRQPGYDVRGARLDPNVVFPLERLRELESDGVIGELAPNAYSFTGACSQRELKTKTGPRWVELLQGEELDAALLVPV
jgi:D-proline reductase (dithiol) PrdB